VLIDDRVGGATRRRRASGSSPQSATPGFDFPTRRVTVNLAPAEVPKEGTGFDLTNGVPITPTADGVSDHVWRVEEIVALLA
jgi:magnesium chelatase family protein